MSLPRGVGVRERDLPRVDIGVRPGYKQRYSGFFDSERGVGARIGSLYAEPYYHSPRHRHTFQQVRYVVAGHMKYGHELYGPGDCLYLPESVPYGPVRPHYPDGTDEKLHFVDIQFMGPSGIPYPEPEEVVAAQRSLAETGDFQEGIYTAADGSKHDAYEAILEKITGSNISYAPSRLSDYVVMRTELYPSTGHPTLPGVSQKHLAFFFESGPNLKFYTLSGGASIPAGKPIGHRALFLLSGSLELDDEQFEAISFFMLPGGVEHGAITAVSDAEVLVLGWTDSRSVLPFELF